MKVFTVDSCFGASDGVDLKHDPYPHVRVGSRWFPAGREDFGETERVTACHPIKTKKGTFLLVKESKPDSKHCLVLMRVRGSDEGCTLRDEDGHVLARMSDTVRRAYGVRVLEGETAPDGTQQALLVLDEGACVQVERKGRLTDDGPTKCWVRWMPNSQGLVVGALADIFPDPDPA